MNGTEHGPTHPPDLAVLRTRYRRWLGQFDVDPSAWTRLRLASAAAEYQAALLAEAVSLKGVPGHRIVIEPGRAMVVIPS